MVLNSAENRSHEVGLALIALARPRLAAGGCAGCGGSATDADGRSAVVAAFYPLAWVAEQVAGDGCGRHATSPARAPSRTTSSLDIEQTAELAEADLVVYEHGFQPAVDEAVEANAPDAGSSTRPTWSTCMPLEHEHEHDEAATTTATSTRTSGSTRC